MIIITIIDGLKRWFKRWSERRWFMTDGFNGFEVKVEREVVNNAVWDDINTESIMLIF